MKYTVYMIGCKTAGTFYIGYSSDIDHRMEMHYRGRGSQFTRKHGCVWYQILDVVDTKTEATRLEREWVLRLRCCDVVVAGAGWSSSLARAA